MTALRPRSPRAFAPLLACLVLGLACPGQAGAQTVTTRNEKAPAGKSVRILASTNLKQDCSEGPAAEIRIATPPANGSLIFKAGKAKTPAKYRCPGKETTVEVLLYQSKPDFSGTDTVKLDIKTSDGKSLSQEVRISVEGKGGEDKDENGLGDL